VKRDRKKSSSTAVEEPQAEEAEPAQPVALKKEKVKEVFDPALQYGAIPPLGYFDPLGICPKGQRNNFRWYRGCEIKHGRLAMIATVGCVVQHYVHIDDIPKLDTYLGILSPNSLGGIILWYGPPGFLSLCTMAAVVLVFEYGLWYDNPRREPGDFGNPFGIPLDSPTMRNKELSNGRFAMVCMAGIWAAELVTGKDCIQQLGFDNPPAVDAVVEAAAAPAALELTKTIAETAAAAAPAALELTKTIAG